MIKFTSPQNRDIYVNPAQVVSIEPHPTDGHTEFTFTNGSTRQVKGTVESSLRALGFGSKDEVKKAEVPKAVAPATVATTTITPTSGSAK